MPSRPSSLSTEWPSDLRQYVRHLWLVYRQRSIVWAVSPKRCSATARRGSVALFPTRDFSPTELFFFPGDGLCSVRLRFGSTLHHRQQDLMTLPVNSFSGKHGSPCRMRIGWQYPVALVEGKLSTIMEYLP